ncbi:MAG: alpha/beta fold hydrolase [Verrucomicrobiota bacterium]
MVVVAHGFSRSKHYMAGLGADLASHGIIAAVLTQPSWFEHLRNAAAIAELARLGRANKWPIDAKGNGKMGLVGFSMGGLTSFLAAAHISPPVDAWVGLDPVDFGGLGAAKAARVNAPGLVLLAATPPFNFRGSAFGLVRDYAGPLQIMTVKNSTHCDVESPTDLLGQLARGWVKPGPQACFRAFPPLNTANGVRRGIPWSALRAEGGSGVVAGEQGLEFADDGA